MAENLGEIECFEWSVTLFKEVRDVVGDEEIDDAEVERRKN